MQKLTRAWRLGRGALSVCLRSVGDDAFYHQLSTEPSNELSGRTAGGPPG
ncbi:hypothetical protein [Kribbella solani]|uniref:Uncharacterized protein n=1 Tax=Kribbella solani TaxID=236067 RepID=A0A841DUX1_9ACTN|nr:hypothetical protein [Kribbella solani]MBB5982412.1 hypothetical protein [Kribbella solani]MDX2972524.1 hypothetical protein [Kribbella solani]MDX3006721.1 hypothetical protein [Kribbella solani]